MTLILSIHPVAQFGAILLAFYAAYLGFQRTKSLHYNKTTQFLRKRHAIVGSIGTYLHAWRHCCRALYG